MHGDVMVSNPSRNCADERLEATHIRILQQFVRLISDNKLSYYWKDY